MNYIVAILITLNIWLGWKYLAWPGYRLWRYFNYCIKNAEALDEFESKPTPVSQILVGAVDPRRARLVAWSMMVAFIMMLWSLGLWGATQAFGGPEGFCTALLDKL